MEEYLIGLKRKDIESEDKLSEISKSDLKRIIEKTVFPKFKLSNPKEFLENCWIWNGTIMDKR